MKQEHVKLHQKFVSYGANAKAWMRKCVLLLPEIDRERIWEQKGFGSIYEYTAKLAGMSRNTVEDALRILRKIEDKPELQKIVEERGIGAIKPVVTIATSETAEFWAEKARSMSKHTLETYVREIRKQEQNSRPGTAENFENSHQEAILISMDLEPEIANQLEKLKGKESWNDLMKEFLEMRAEKLKQEKPEAVETDSRHIPAKIKKHVLARSKGRCEFPNCTKPYEILHHTDRFALKKTHDPDHIIALCKPHERIVHQGLIEDESVPAKSWKILKTPDEYHPKFQIDQLVQKFRNFAAG